MADETTADNDFITKTKKNYFVILLVCCVSFFLAENLYILSRKRTENLTCTLESKE